MAGSKLASARGGGAELPAGFAYEPSFLTHEEEHNLLERFAALEFRPFNFQGFVARRRVVEYGFEYDFSLRRASAAQPLPDFLADLQQRAAEWAGISKDGIREAIITEYPAGAPIGWHRDVQQFEDVIGISLKSSCRMRFKPYKGVGRIASIVLEPRSIYLMRGPARWEYQHSIPAVAALRYSITFRTLRKSQKRVAA